MNANTETVTAVITTPAGKTYTSTEPSLYGCIAGFQTWGAQGERRDLRDVLLALVSHEQVWGE